MIDFYGEKERLAALKESVKTSKDGLKCHELSFELSEIKKKQGSDGYWLNIEASTADNQRLAQIEKKLARINEAESQITYIEELIELGETMEEQSIIDEVAEVLAECEKKTEALMLETLLKGKYDNLNAILTIHAGAGGTEAQDWAEMLYRMYTRFAERDGFDIKLLDYQAGDGAGIKSVTFMLTGDNAYGFLKAEKGVHRLVRISPFDANKRRHTSFASLEVMPEIIYDDEIKIAPEDLKVDTLRSGGAGGQHVNKTESAVRLTHIPSGIVVLCQNERSQIQNREIAMRLLLSKLAEKREREQLEAASSIKGELKKIEWGSQIRSYVFCPYTLVKDHRTGYENTDVNKVMDGDIEGFIFEYLKKS